MNGIKFENQIFQSNQHEKPTKLMPENLKTTPKFIDKNQEFVVPLNDKSKKKFHFFIYIMLVNFIFNFDYQS